MDLPSPSFSVVVMEAALAEAGVLAIAAPLLRLAAAQPLAQAVPVAILTAAAGAFVLLLLAQCRGGCVSVGHVQMWSRLIMTVRRAEGV